MSVIYVASSKTLSTWGASVGISKSLYKVGLTLEGESAADAIAALNEASVASAQDWKLVKASPERASTGDLDADDLDAEDLAARLNKADIVVDPTYYPKLRRAAGIVRVRPETVENSLLVERAMANEANLTMKIKPVDIADWLIRLALR